MSGGAEHQFITPRRNFLIRALGFTAAGVTMPIPIVTLADAKTRIDHHKAGLMAAWSDYCAGAKCTVQGNDLEPRYVVDWTGWGACLIFYATTRKADLRLQARRFSPAGFTITVNFGYCVFPTLSGL